MASALQLKKESVVTRTKSVRKKEVTNQTAETLKQLLMRPNITIKKTILLDNYKAQSVKIAKLPATTQTCATAKRLDIPRKETTGKKVMKKVDRSRSLLISENTEYYPDKHKRNWQTKKIVLQPKHDYKVVAATNKRKRRIPRRELKSSPPILLSCVPDPEMSVEDLVRMADEQGMDDEDFMEILTCPSPVWWEGGDEEETCVRFQENKYENDNVKHENEITIENTQITSDCLKGRSLKSDLNFFKKFVKKRSKLETVLYNIKYKKTEPEITNQYSINNETRIKERKNSVGSISDVSINEEELLKTLENIEIPVQETNRDFEDVNNIENETNEEIINKPTNKRNSQNDKSNQRKRTRKPRKKNNKFKKNEVAKENDVIKSNEMKEKDLELVPTDLPPLTKNPFRNIPIKSAYESPKSIDSVLSGTTNSSTLEFDSISDTNIKFLDEYLDEKTNNPIDSETNLKTNDGDLMTVYKIITNQMENVDVEEQIKMNVVDKSPVLNTCDRSTYKNKNKGNINKKDTRKINSFYKTRKKICKKKVESK